MWAQLQWYRRRSDHDSLDKKKWNTASFPHSSFLSKTLHQINLLLHWARLMSTPQWNTADILCVLASCGRQHTGEHRSSAVARRIVWTQAHGALERRGGCILSPLQARPTRAQHKPVFGETGVNISVMYVHVCLQCKKERKKRGEKREVAAWLHDSMSLCLCVCVYVCLHVLRGVLVYLAGSLVEGGFCKEEVCYSQDSCWYLADEEYQRTEKREETDKDKIEWRQREI